MPHRISGREVDVRAAGATSPFAAAIHALVVLAAVLVAAPPVTYVPMAALAALLLLVAWNMSDLPPESVRQAAS